jgi:hypothetical protein
MARSNPGKPLLMGEKWIRPVTRRSSSAAAAPRSRKDRVPPVASKIGDTRYFHLHQEDERDEARFADWVRQASGLPGEKM